MAGETLTSKSYPFGYKNFGGGLNSTFGPLTLKESESSKLQNVDFDRSGSILKRNGYSRLNSSAFNSGAAWTSLHWFELSTGTDYLMGTCGNKLGKMDDLDGTWDDVTGALTITAGNNNHFQWATFLDTALGTNNVDVPIQWTGAGNGSAMTVPTNLTKAKYIAVWQNYIFLANITLSATAHPTRFYWSDLKALTWTDTNFIDVDRNDGQEITGIKPLGNRLVILKERSIHAVSYTGDSDVPFVVEKSPSHVGAIHGYSVQEIDNAIKFRSQDGWYLFDGNNSYKTSDRITVTSDTMNANRFQNMVSAYQKSKNRYWAATTNSGDSTHNRCIVWDSFNNAWSVYKGHNANCFAILNTSGQERIYFGDYSGFVYRADTGTNDNPSGTETAIDAYWYSKWIDYEDIVNSKGVPHTYVYYLNNNATMTFTYAYDFEDSDQYTQTFSTATGSSLYGTAVYDTDVYGGTGGSVRRRDMTGRGRVIRLGFKNSTLSESFRIDGFGMLPHLETYA